MIAIINLGISNLGSLQNALKKVGEKSTITNEPDQLTGVSRIILPGVGSFYDAISLLNKHGLGKAIQDAVMKEKIPILGICLGMQLLATQGTEGGMIQGLDLIPGNVIHLKQIGCNERVPHAGWNDVMVTNQHCPLLNNIPNGSDFYFIHSYTFQPTDDQHIFAKTDYGVSFSSVVGKGSIWGTQFHPEKSSKAGLQLLKNFVEL
ncbi:glutamine amidotransferase [Methanocalculus alkaliphilus]|uniref:imidazole glycerol phosphate synthase subunit HisH n=1 Tax=Methanocalculus alkaliphilus TaxID=768730 RepID=UPI00209D8122|nr:imidazole glycerol phosphate synthase subunit HisH [Methanocalculus alkaliphilus]MCP1716324.1 glutamine amidotransferase [Methanocalculus alkaliphilus]